MKNFLCGIIFTAFIFAAWGVNHVEAKVKAHVLFDAKHKSLERWRVAWPDDTPTGAKIKLFENQARVIGTSTSLFYGMVYQNIEWDLDKYPILEIEVTACNAAWYLVIQNPNIEDGFSKNDYIKPEKGTKAVGKRAYNIRKATGLNGVRRIRLELGIATSERPANKGLSFTFSSLKLVSSSRAKKIKVVAQKGLSEAEEAALEKATLETSVLGWSNRAENGGSSGAHLQKTEDEKIKLIGDYPHQCYGCVNKELTVDFEEYPKLEIKVGRLTANMYVIFSGPQFRGGYHRLEYISKPGRYIYDLAGKFNYLKGPQTFILKLGVTTEDEKKPNRGHEIEFSSVKFIGKRKIKLVAGFVPSQLIQPLPSLIAAQPYTKAPLPVTYKKQKKSLDQGGLQKVFGEKHRAQTVSQESSPPGFSETGNQLTIQNKYYQVILSRKTGVFESLTDRINNSRVSLGFEHAYLWRIMFKEGTFLNSEEFLADKEAKFSYRWIESSRTLRLLSQRGSSVMAVNLVFSNYNYFDLYAKFQNHEDKTVIGVEMPKLSFDYGKLERFYLPWRMGIAFNQQFFKNKRRWKTTYPFLFSDFINWSLTDGGQFSSFLLWADKPIESTRINVGYARGRRGVYEHVWTTYIEPKTSWEGQPLRMVFGEKVEAALRRFKKDNKLTKAPLLIDKLGKTLFSKIRQGVLLKISLDMNRSFRYVNKYFKELPKGTIVHFVAWWLEGFDRHMPDFWPVDPTFGTNADFKKSIALAKKHDLVVMPYTNPTFWNISPTLERAGGPEEIASRDLKNDLKYEFYPSGGKGWAASPRHPAVVKAGNHIANKFFKEYGIDILFLDQIGARFIYFDLNPTLKNPIGYCQAWYENCEAYLKLGPLFTEQGYDRLIPMMSGFSGLASFTVPESVDYNNLFGEGNWEYFPIAQYLGHEHVCFFHHDLAHEVFCESHEKIVWYLAHGYHMLNGRWVSRWHNQKKWFALADQLQKRVVSKYVGKPLLNYSQPEPNRIFWSAYPDLGILANISNVHELEVLNHTVSKNGFIATNNSGTFLAGRFSRLYGFDLTGDQYLVIEREKNRITVIQLQQYQKTLLTLPRPAEWKFDEAITVRQGGRPITFVATTPQTISFYPDAVGAATEASTYVMEYNAKYKQDYFINVRASKLSATVNTEIQIGLEARNLSQKVLSNARLALSAWLVKRNEPVINSRAGYATLSPQHVLKTRPIPQLASGQVISTVFPFQIPSTAEAGDIIWLKGELITPRGRKVKTVSSQGIVKVISPFEVDILTDQQAVSAGKWTKLEVEVKNNFTEKVRGRVMLNLPKAWKGKKEEKLDLNTGKTKKLTFSVLPPSLEKKKTYDIIASFRVKKNFFKSKPQKVEVLPVWRIISCEGPRVLVKGKKSTGIIRLIASGNMSTQGTVMLTPSKGLQVEPQELNFSVPKGGEVLLEFSILPLKARKETLGFELRCPQEIKRFKLIYPVVVEGEAKVLMGDIMKRGDEDVILANAEVEIQAVQDIGGRIMAFYHRETGANMLYQNYPKIAKRKGDRDWIEYGGINDWFPSGWPGVVWNNHWEAEIVTDDGNEAAVKMYTKTRKGLLLERTMILPAKGRRLQVDYQVTNLSGDIMKYQWFNHPDLAPGKNNFADEQHRMIMPISDPENKKRVKFVTEKFIAKIDKDSYEPRAGWVVGLNQATKDYFMQLFKHEEIGQIGVWQDSNFYTMELLGKEVTLKPGEKRNFTVFYIVGNNNWKEEIK